MESKLKHFSFEQLSVLKYFLSYPDKTRTIKEMAKHTGVAGKSLGGILSSLSRNIVGGEALIEAYGRAPEGGLRWRLNLQATKEKEALRQVKRLLKSYE